MTTPGPGKLHERRTAPGRELTILRLMPWAFTATTVLLLALSGIVRWLPVTGLAAASAKQVLTVDIFVIAGIVTMWTGLLTVTLGCVLVHIMKGPAYVADAYPLETADERPATPRGRNSAAPGRPPVPRAGRNASD